MKTFIGKVISNPSENTVKIVVERTWMHPTYRKRIIRSTKYLVHSDKEIKVGSDVKIAECAKISKNKNWKILEVIKK